jgi:hypothetical protein
VGSQLLLEFYAWLGRGLFGTVSSFSEAAGNGD